MRKYCIYLIVILLFTGLACDQDPLKTTIDYSKGARKNVLQTQAQRALEQYKSKHGEWPSSLDGVAGLPELPEPWKWTYNADNGKITVGNRK